MCPVPLQSRSRKVAEWTLPTGDGGGLNVKTQQEAQASETRAGQGGPILIPPQLTPFQVLAGCLTVSSLAGLAALLRSKQALTWRNVIATCLYSGMFGLIYGLIWFEWFDGENQNFFFLIGTSGLVGLGGASLLDFVVDGLLNGFNITISTKKKSGGKQGGENGDSK